VLELWRYLAFVEPLPQAATRTREWAGDTCRGKHF
jgi:hypothetical protein